MIYYVYLINQVDALKALAQYHDRFLFRTLQQLHVHDLRAKGVLRRRRMLKPSALSLSLTLFLARGSVKTERFAKRALRSNKANLQSLII